MADLARRFASAVARFDDTMAYEPEHDGLTLACPASASVDASHKVCR